MKMNSKCYHLFDFSLSISISRSNCFYWVSSHSRIPLFPTLRLKCHLLLLCLHHWVLWWHCHIICIRCGTRCHLAIIWTKCVSDIKKLSNSLILLHFHIFPYKNKCLIKPLTWHGIMIVVNNLRRYKLSLWVMLFKNIGNLLISEVCYLRILKFFNVRLDVFSGMTTIVLESGWLD